MERPEKKAGELCLAARRNFRGKIRHVPAVHCRRLIRILGSEAQGG